MREIELSNGIKLRTFPPPPHGFDPCKAGEHELARHGFLPRPSGQPLLLEQWDRLMVRPATFIEPVIGPRIQLRSDVQRTEGGIPSTNWCGGSVFPKNGDSFYSVEAHWKVPLIYPPVADGTTYRCNSWVGVDGANGVGGEVLQIGVDTIATMPAGSTDLSSVLRKTQAWWQWNQDDLGALCIENFPVSPGDEVDRDVYHPISRIMVTAPPATAARGTVARCRWSPGRAPRVAACRFRGGSEAAEQVGPRGVQQVIPVKLAGRRDRLDERERCRRAIHLGNRHCPVQRHDGRGFHAFKKIVELEDSRPVRDFGPRRLTVHGRDSRLQRKGAGPAAKRLRDQRQGLGDLPLIPQSAILILQKDEITGFIETGSTPGIMKQHEGQKCGCFRGRLGRRERPHQPPQTDRLGAEIRPQKRFATGGGIAFVEDEINHRQHGMQALGHVAAFRARSTGCRRHGSSASRTPDAAPSSRWARETRERSRRSRGRPAFATSARPAPHSQARDGSR